MLHSALESHKSSKYSGIKISKMLLLYVFIDIVVVYFQFLFQFHFLYETFPDFSIKFSTKTINTSHL